ncbi:MAG: lateral flagellin LafA [Pseudomonadota bacterium]|jgi:flagellin
MQVNTNVSSFISANALQSAQRDISNSVQRISTGVKMSQDDPSSIGTSARLKAQIGSLTKANDSITKGMGALQMMDSSLGEITSILLSMKDLAVASNNASASSDDKTANDLAYQQLLTALGTASAIPKLGDTDLLKSTAGMTFRVGSASTSTLAVPTFDTQAAALSLTGTNANAAAAAAETALDTAINTVSGYQAKIGGTMKVLEALGNVNDSVITGATTAYSSITSTDLAKETANLAASQIRQNAAAAMFAQSNTMSREVVSYLLKGI